MILRMHRTIAEGRMRRSVVQGAMYWDILEQAALCVDRAAAVKVSGGSACISNGLEGCGLAAWRNVGLVVANR